MGGGSARKLIQSLLLLVLGGCSRHCRLLLMRLSMCRGAAAAAGGDGGDGLGTWVGVAAAALAAESAAATVGKSAAGAAIAAGTDAADAREMTSTTIKEATTIYLRVSESQSVHYAIRTTWVK